MANLGEIEHAGVSSALIFSITAWLCAITLVLMGMTDLFRGICEFLQSLIALMDHIILNFLVLMSVIQVTLTAAEVQAVTQRVPPLMTKPHKRKTRARSFTTPNRTLSTPTVFVLKFQEDPTTLANRRLVRHFGHTALIVLKIAEAWRK